MTNPNISTLDTDDPDWQDTHIANLRLVDLRDAVLPRWAGEEDGDPAGLPGCLEKDAALAALAKVIALRLGDQRKLNPNLLNRYAVMAMENCAIAKTGGTPYPPPPEEEPPPPADPGVV